MMIGLKSTIFHLLDMDTFQKAEDIGTFSVHGAKELLVRMVVPMHKESSCELCASVPLRVYIYMYTHKYICIACVCVSISSTGENPTIFHPNEKCYSAD